MQFMEKTMIDKPAEQWMVEKADVFLLHPLERNYSEQSKRIDKTNLLQLLRVGFTMEQLCDTGEDAIVDYMYSKNYISGKSRGYSIRSTIRKLKRCYA